VLVGAYLLARELGVGRLARRSRAAFAYAPYRVTEAGHLHVISSGGIPLALSCCCGLPSGSRALVLAGLARIRLADQPRLHPRPCSTAICCWPHADRAVALVARAPAGRRASDPTGLLTATCVGLAVLGVIVVYQARPYLRVASLYPTAARTIKESEGLLLGARVPAVASSENRVWGS